MKDKISAEIYKKLNGKVSYLKSFPYYKNKEKDLILKHTNDLQKIKRKRQQEQQ